MTTISITQNSDGSFALRLRGSDSFIFHELIQELKLRVPPRRRGYDPDTKTWTIFSRELLDGWLDYARSLDGVRVFWKDEDTKQQAPPPPPPPRPGRMRREDALVALHLLPTAPPEVIKACHKALALIFHPDRGGDLEAMKTVNAAFDLLTKECGK